MSFNLLLIGSFLACDRIVRQERRRELRAVFDAVRITRVGFFHVFRSDPHQAILTRSGTTVPGAHSIQSQPQRNITVAFCLVLVRTQLLGQRLDFSHQRLLLLLKLLLALLRLFLEAGHGLIDLTGHIGIALAKFFVFFQHFINVFLQLGLLGSGSP
ncbi:Uncharacterised protein [Acinetobacter baumannii]|nr:Uncharacterised protein [Acinetobacter baumannii]